MALSASSFDSVIIMHSIIQLSYSHPFKAKYLEPYPQNVYIDRYAHQRDVLAARTQRTQPKLREFRARARTAVRRPPA